MPANAIVIAQTKKWITDVVVGCGFCPFAAREVKRGSIHYEVLRTGVKQKILKTVTKALKQLDADSSIETTLLIFPVSFRDFDAYLEILSSAEVLLGRSGYEGIYQLASFHPHYLFADAAEDDAANFTNRSPYPMLHLLREASVTLAVDSHPDAEGIPQRNIRYARKKGFRHMQLLLESCLA